MYLSVYAIWRFVIEYARDDYRGDTFIDVLTPSQLIACVLFAIGVGLVFLERCLKKRFPYTPKKQNDRAENKDDTDK